NIISCNGNSSNYAGIHTFASGTVVEGNVIGLGANGNALGGQSNGVIINGGATNVTIGGNALGAGNVISGNGGYGVQIVEAATSGNQVEGNIIGLDASGSTAIGPNGNPLGRSE